MNARIFSAGDCLCPPHTSNSAGVAINWSHNLGPGVVDRALFTFTELATGAQTSVEVPPQIHYCFSLVEGVYRVAVRAIGLAPYSGVVELTAGRVAPLNPVLTPRVDVTPSLQSVLASLDVPKPNVNPRDLEVPARTTIALDSSHPWYKQDWQSVQLKDVETAKRIIGHSDDLWGIDHPRFGTQLAAAVIPARKTWPDLWEMSTFMVILPVFLNGNS